MKLVLLADSHAHHRNIKLPGGDVLIHAGDVSYRGEKLEIMDFLSWFQKQPFSYKIFIAGNHDFFFEKATAREIAAIIPHNIIYLNDSGVCINNINFWGSPYTPKYYNWAFGSNRGADIRQHWNRIPENTNVLITHGPPYGILDQTASGEHVGCKDLLHKINSLKLSVHVFGHIHESHGREKKMGTRFFNASVMNENYELLHLPYQAVL